VEDEEFLAAETTAGYAKPMSEAYQHKQAALVAEHIKTQDIIITTAQIPGRIAPRLLTKAMLETLKPGSVVMDLAVDHGGNCELSVAGQVVEVNGVQIAGYLNIPGRLAASTSQLFARNVSSYLEALLDVSDGVASLKADDDIVKATRLSHGGVLVHPHFGGSA
jgi:NAD(P) transhydrogenase subunit alpha